MFAHARVVTWCTTHAKCPHWRKRTAGRFTGVRFHSAIINNVIWKSKKYEQNKRKDNTSVLTLQEIFCAITIYLIHVDPGVTADQSILYTWIHNYIYRPRTKTCSGSSPIIHIAVTFDLWSLADLVLTIEDKKFLQADDSLNQSHV